MTDRTLLTNATVLACTAAAAESCTQQDVLIEGSGIVDVRAGLAQTIERAATRVIDLRGATVMPGLGDAHVHISWPLDFVFDHGAVARSAPDAHAYDVAAVTKTYLESGYTLVIGAGVLQPKDDLLAKRAIDRGELSGPRIIPSGLMVAQKGGLGDEGGLMEVVSDATSIREVVARQCDAGVRAVKLFISGDSAAPGYPSEAVYMNDAMLEAAVKEAERYGAFVTAHARAADSVEMAARSGIRIIHHACFLHDAALRALEARNDVWVCPGLHYLYAMVNGHAEPWGISANQVASFGYPRELESQVEGLQRMMSAGIQLVAGGDFGHQWTHHGTYAVELQRYVELVGMTPREAILTATRNMGPLVNMKLGQVAPGYLADLLVVDGDPTGDIGILQDSSKRRAVLKDGKLAYVNPDLVI